MHIKLLKLESFTTSLSKLIIKLAVAAGITKRILCSDWLPERERWAYLVRRDPVLGKKLREAPVQSSKFLDSVGDGVVKAAAEHSPNIENINDPVGFLSRLSKETSHSWFLSKRNQFLPYD